MHLQTISLRNFRCFDERRFALSERFTLVSGNTSSGKTALLDAIALALAALPEALGLPDRPLDAADARLGAPARPGAPRQPLTPVTISCAAQLGDLALTWQRGLVAGAAGLEPRDDRAGLDPWRSAVATALSAAQPAPLPVLAHYTDAHSAETSRPPNAGAPGADERSAPSVAPVAPPPADPRLAALAGILAPFAAEAMAVERLSRLAAAAAQDSAARLELDAITGALSQALGGGDPVRVELVAGALTLAVGDEPPLAWSRFGGAFRRVASLFTDLAARCFALHPHHGARAPAEAPGVVLIDVLEAQLHPRWQRHLIEDLRRVFPRLQFVATTNSPFIIQSLHDGALIDLDGNPPAEYPDLSIEDITEQILGVRVPQRSKRYLDMQDAAMQVLALVRQGEGADPEERRRLQARLDELMMPFSNNQAWHALLMMERVEAGLGGDEEDAT